MEINNNWKVYCHTNKINNKKYIGITSKINPNDRWKNGKGYVKSQKHFYDAIQKYGWENFKSEILFENLSKSEACQKEIELIKLYNTTDKNKGYNLSNGGDAIFSGRKHSDETKNKISEILKSRNIHVGKDNPMYGVSSPMKGKHHSNETKNKISIALKERNKKDKSYIQRYINNSRKVNQYDLNGNFIKSWASTSVASQELNIPRANIGKICARGIRKDGVVYRSAGGFQWRYIDDCDDITLYKTNKASHQSQAKAIYLVDKFGEIIKEFESIELASKELNLNPSSISKVCRGNYSTTKGYIFKYKQKKVGDI